MQPCNFRLKTMKQNIHQRPSFQYTSYTIIPSLFKSSLVLKVLIISVSLSQQNCARHNQILEKLSMDAVFSKIGKFIIRDLKKKFYMSLTQIRKPLSPLAPAAFVSISSEIKREKKKQQVYTEKINHEKISEILILKSLIVLLFSIKPVIEITLIMSS